MARGILMFEQPNTGEKRSAPVGFSWTALFFGPFPALFRSDYLGFLIIFLIAVATFGISNLIACFIYNKFYIKTLISNGFKAKTSKGEGLDLVDVEETRLGITIPRLL